MKAPQRFSAIDRQVWLPLFDKLLPPELPQLRRRALAIVTALRNRHVGITANLAVTLALCIGDAATRDRVRLTRGTPLAAAMGIWEGVAERLKRAAARADARVESHPQLAMHPAFALFKIAEPLLRAAAATAGFTVVFADEGDDLEENSHYAQEVRYREYEEALMKALQGLLNGRTADLAWEPFWEDRARTLHAFAGPQAARAPAPEIGALERAAVSRLQTDPQEAKHLLLRRRVLARTDAASVAQMEGISGIRLTRNPDDLGQMLFSESLYPDWLFADRWLNSGFLIKQRHARRERLRDVLVTAFLPGDLHDQPVRAWLCPLWLDTAARFTRAILKADLTRSELRWIEGDLFDRHRSLTKLVSGLAPHAGHESDEAAARFRWIFHRRLRWLPSIMDAHAGYTPLRRPVQGAAPQDAARAWLRAVWESQEENLSWPGSPQRKGAALPLDVEEFAHCIAMVFLPASLRKPGKGETPASPVTAEGLSGLLTQSEEVPCQTIVTWVPDDWLNPAEWAVGSSIDGSAGEWLVEEGEGCDMMELFTRLQERWLHLLFMEIGGGA